MNNNLTLYELIKQKSQEKGRPLKIICDWDDSLQPCKPLMIYLNSQLNSPFKEFFQRFWENFEGVSPTSSGRRIGEYNGTPEERKAVLEFEKKRRASQHNPKEHGYFKIDNFYKKTPFFSFHSWRLITGFKRGFNQRVDDY